MDMEYFEHIVKNEEILEKINQAETMDEAQLIVLFLIRNNLSSMRNEINKINKWINIIAALTIISFIINFGINLFLW
jgi:hypothetical protein